jgi:putative acetyltransferase
MEDLRIRPDQHADADAVRGVIMAAFGQEAPAHATQVADLWADVVVSGFVKASLVARLGERIVGHVGVSHAWLDARRGLVDVAMLSPLSVLPVLQRLGIGTALVGSAIEAARNVGAPALFLEGSPSYYGSRGFERAGRHGFEPASVRTPGAAFQVALLDAHEDWMTGRLVYRDVWWKRDSAGLRDPDLAELERLFASLPD